MFVEGKFFNVGMAEWLKAAVLKTVIYLYISRVRISLPPFFFRLFERSSIGRICGLHLQGCRFDSDRFQKFFKNFFLAQ